MKPTPAPHVPGNTDYERFDNALRKVLSVSKEAAAARDESRAIQQRSKETVAHAKNLAKGMQRRSR